MRSDYDFFVQLKEIGRGAAQKFLDAHFDDVGVRATLDLKEALT